MSFQYRHPLSRLIEPASVAIVGANDRPGTVGYAVLRNVIAGGYRGSVHVINPRHESVGGVRAYPRLTDLPDAPDLVLVATRPETLPAIVADAIESRSGGLAILTAHATRPDSGGRDALDHVRVQAREAGLRILGPNSLGLMRPSVGLNASFSQAGIRAGSVALLSQSGGFASAVLDWALADAIGFSTVLSLGNQLDVGFAEALGYLTEDMRTDSIVLYLEGVNDARRFLSALRAAARIKPVVVLKAGRGPAGARAATTHTGVLTGPDAAFDAALRRCGAVRVSGFLQLFSAAKYLSSRYRPVGRNLAVVTNGGGPGVMAVDRASDVGLSVHPLAPETIAELDRALPHHWSRANPVDLMEDARPEHFRAAIALCQKDAGVDGLVTVVTPQTMSDPLQIAQDLREASSRGSKPIIACFMGDATMREPLRVLQDARIPTFRSPEPAVEAFATIAEFYENQRLLMQVPGPLTGVQAPPDTRTARAIIEAARAAGRHVLFESETKAILAAFLIPTAPVTVAGSADEAVSAATRIGFPVALKIHSRDVTHKSDIGGVELNVHAAEGVRAAYERILRNAARAPLPVHVDGVAVEPMLRSDTGRELMIGVLRDAVFGPVITLGAGGRNVEIYADQAAALPPLNEYLARSLIARTRVATTLGEWRGWPAAHVPAVEGVLLRVSEMCCELPDIEALDINPVIVDATGAVVADARMVISPGPAAPVSDRYPHMAICPYPAGLSCSLVLADGTDVTVRPIRPEDAEMEQAFVRRLSDESRYFRFANSLHELSESMLVRFTQIDYDRELALVALVTGDSGPTQIGVARYVMVADDETCEFAVVVADAWQTRGIGRRLMTCLIEAARMRGLQTMFGYVLGQNTKMLRLMTTLGFEIHFDPEDSSMRRVVLPLQAGNSGG
ncbi:MAG: GNAT family N-acetyltransferase [Betaproteobacteria bacterium]|nr:GNAT family N-acetyltransferase [Betaproteobacteria bacterium]